MRRFVMLASFIPYQDDGARGGKGWNPAGFFSMIRHELASFRLISFKVAQFFYTG